MKCPICSALLPHYDKDVHYTIYCGKCGEVYRLKFDISGVEVWDGDQLFWQKIPIDTKP